MSFREPRDIRFDTRIRDWKAGGVADEVKLYVKLWLPLLFLSSDRYQRGQAVGHLRTDEKCCSNYNIGQSYDNIDANRQIELIHACVWFRLLY